MIGRFRETCTLIPTVTIVAIILSIGCNNKADEIETVAKVDSVSDTLQKTVEALPQIKTLVDSPADTPESLRRKIRKVVSWTPKQEELVNSVFKDVGRIVTFADLGLGDQLEFAAPRTGSAEQPSVSSLQLVLGRIKTALVARFVVDTLPGPRVRGEGSVALIGIHGDTLFGHDVVLPRTQSSSGRLEFVYLFESLYLQTCCCGIPGSYGIGRYGSFGDTLTAIFVFIPSIGMYSITLAGQDAWRTFPGYQYTVFRTERGEFHREMEGYPYLLKDRDPAYVNLYFGRGWRGRKSCHEPVLTVRMF
jgi:hypothetical protein